MKEEEQGRMATMKKEVEEEAWGEVSQQILTPSRRVPQRICSKHHRYGSGEEWGSDGGGAIKSSTVLL